MRNRVPWSAALLVGLVSTTLSAGVLLEPVDAPEWQISEWLNRPGGRLADHRQKVVVIHFFQLWCPGCNEFSIPLIQEWEKELGDREDLVFVSIHTVFEGHAEQSPERLREFVLKKGITHPVGIDAYTPGGGSFPVTMERFETGGTPHLAIIDRNGQLRFSHFGRFDPEPVHRFLVRMLDEEKLEIESEPRTKLTAQDRRKDRRGRENIERARKSNAVQPPQRPQRRPEPDAGSDPAADDASSEDDRSEDDRSEDTSPDDDSEDRDRDEKGEEDTEKPDVELSGSFKLRFDTQSVSCGDVPEPTEVITQVTVRGEQIIAKFSRPYLGLRQLNAEFDPGSGTFEIFTEQQAKEKGGVPVQVSVQASGRFVSINDPPEIEFEFFVEKSSEDRTYDCVIEGRGGGPRFRAR